MFYSTLSLIKVFVFVFEIFDLKYTVTLKPGLGSLKVIVTDTVRSAICEFILTLLSNHGPILYRFRDNQRLPSKITNFSYPRVFRAPFDGVSLGFGYQPKGPRK